eukprot:TRINITY_DN66234_c11_g2_i1.p1 TRINITY_DN66234_c11_g2~~TRINITY_DN66234_c11_g2_i1.p1  ORF type:complete len:188 (+),score=56.31 TRINITY_DN66234_c11_g2_i1:897-1460(+)
MMMMTTTADEPPSSSSLSSLSSLGLSCSPSSSSCVFCIRRSVVAAGCGYSTTKTEQREMIIHPWYLCTLVTPTELETWTAKQWRAVAPAAEQTNKNSAAPNNTTTTRNNNKGGGGGGTGGGTGGGKVVSSDAFRVRGGSGGIGGSSSGSGGIGGSSSGGGGCSHSRFVYCSSVVGSGSGGGAEQKAR